MAYLSSYHRAPSIFFVGKSLVIVEDNFVFLQHYFRTYNRKFLFEKNGILLHPVNSFSNRQSLTVAWAFPKSFYFSDSVPYQTTVSQLIRTFLESFFLLGSLVDTFSDTLLFAYSHEVSSPTPVVLSYFLCYVLDFCLYPYTVFCLAKLSLVLFFSYQIRLSNICDIWVHSTRGAKKEVEKNNIRHSGPDWSNRRTQLYSFMVLTKIYSYRILFRLKL